MSLSSNQIQGLGPVMSSSNLAKFMNEVAAIPSGTVQEAQRLELLQACENLKRSLETPLESTLRIIFGVSCNNNR